MLVKWEVFLGDRVEEDNSPWTNLPSDNPMAHYI